MGVLLEKKVKNSAKSRVLIVQNNTELGQFKLPKKHFNYFSDKVKEGKVASINDAGNFIFVVPFSSLNKKQSNGSIFHPNWTNTMIKAITTIMGKLKTADPATFRCFAANLMRFRMQHVYNMTSKASVPKTTAGHQ